MCNQTKTTSEVKYDTKRVFVRNVKVLYYHTNNVLKSLPDIESPHFDPVLGIIFFTRYLVLSRAQNKVI